ncbi:MAG: epoxyqueuosine reductase QueH [Oscillospiraceae bacterium]|nr:epoxyqueuosine reductase QueH [Oscillospiraceae bacterium]
MKILLHACCAPCAIAPLNALREEGMNVTFFWHNPNIAPEEEHARRREGLHKLAKAEKVTVYERGTSLALPKDCRDCYAARLDETAGFVPVRGYDAFTTTLLVSPYQNHDLIRELGEKYSAFLYRDFRPLFRQGQRLAREMGLYMQKYCGCGREDGQQD